jgi:hypothetical protein
MPRRHLSFSLTVAERVSEFEEGPYLEFVVRPLIDGQSPYQEADREHVFSAMDILIQGRQPGALDIFTCSCGVAGCAGIHYDCHLESDAETVRWKFPESPFRKCLSQALRPAGEPIVVEFDRGQYEQALAELERDLETLTEGRPGQWAVAPASGPYSARESQSFRHFLKICQARYREYAEHQAEIQEAEGELADLALQTTLPNGDVMQANLGSLVWWLVPEGISDRTAYVRDVLRARFLADPAGIFVRECPVEEWGSLFGRVESLQDEDWIEAWPVRFAGQLEFRVVADVCEDDEADTDDEDAS